MIFLNPLFLVGLGAAAIPVIIHLLNLRKVRTIEFSTLSFLKELQRTHIRRMKLRQLFLLILRTLLIIFIVLAFSRPAIRTAGGIIPTARDANTTVAILLDNSPSMEVYNEHGNVFRQALDRAMQTVGLLSAGDNVLLLRQSDLPDATTATPTADRERIRHIIDETEIIPVHRDFHQGVLQAYNVLRNSMHLNRELYIITDMQASHWSAAGTEISPVFDERYRAFVIPIHVEHFPNAAVHALSFRSSLFETGKPVTMDVEIRNHGSVDFTNHSASVYLDGSRIAQQAVNIPANGAAVVDFTIIPDRAGIVEGYVELEDDALNIDNRYYFTITIPDLLRVLLVAPAREDVRYVETALAARSNGSSTSAIQTKFITTGNFPTEDLSTYNSVIAVNVPSFSDIQADRIVRYISQGGGFIIFPGDHIDVRDYNRTLLAKLGLPEIRDITRHAGRDTGPLQFDHVDYDHPIFQDIFEEQLRERLSTDERIESPRIFQSLATAAPGTADTPVITLSDGQAFLVSGRRENGTVLLYSVYPGMHWSDFPLKGIFVPLLHRSLLYVSAAGHDTDRYTAGENITVSIPALQTALQSDYVLVSPDGTEERIQPQHRAAAGILQFSFNSLFQTGLYRIQQNGSSVKSFAVNIHPGESIGGRINPETISEKLERFGIRDTYIIDREDDFASVVQETRYGQELWKLFAILAFLTALIETIVSRDSKQQMVEEQKLSD
jgi:hypothetical protein